MSAISYTMQGQRVQFVRLAQPIGPFFLMGNIEEAPGRLPAIGAELWRADGRWREDGQPHELDLDIVLPRPVLT